MGLAVTKLDTTCAKCRLPAQRVETEIEERLYGDRFLAVITARIFTHVHEDGTRMVCKERVPEWLFTLGPQEEIEKFRANVTAFMAKWGGDSFVYKVL